MPSDMEELASGYFHAMRAKSKKRGSGDKRIYEAIMARRRLEEAAERHAWEVASER